MKKKIKVKSVPGDAGPTYEKVKYGLHDHDRNFMNVWLAESDEPTPVLFMFHPGGFRPRPISKIAPIGAQVHRGALAAGISVMAPTYRPAAPAAFHDAARALQFVRNKALEWNIDAQRIASYGSSSGACLSLWLAFHNDMAKPRSKDPIARESTRLTCVAVTQAVTSVDPRFIRALMPGSNAYRNFDKLFAIDMNELDQLPEEMYQLMEECSPINHVTEDAPPTLLTYNGKLDAPYGVHHASFGKVLKEKMDSLGVRCELMAGGQPVAGSQSKTIMTFIKEELVK